jgi:nucleotide-binding universal stress UspA family protein
VTSSIVCGIDGSPDARLALRTAAQLSGQLGVRLVVAHIVQARVTSPAGSMTPGGPRPMASPVEAELEAGERLLEQILSEEGLEDAERRVVYGFPADRLADLADEEQAELIVVGSRGRGALKAAFLGSVSTDLIGVARRPVLVVPPGTAANERAHASRTTIGAIGDGS